MRLIDADALIKELDRKHYSMASRKQIYSQPTIDAVPVVRCKDCKHLTAKTISADHIYFWCSHYGWKIADWFCSAGERKDDLSLEKTIDKTSNNEEVQE